jgi:hypothetical protein
MQRDEWIERLGNPDEVREVMHILLHTSEPCMNDI